MDTKSIAQSKNFKTILWLIGAAVVVLVIFEAGEFVGYREAEFSYRWGESYYRGFGGHRNGPPAASDLGGDFMMGHGLFGSVIKASSSSLVMQTRDNTEEVVLISSSTAIRRFRDAIAPADLQPSDYIVVIGTPNTAGQVEARLIRVLPSSTIPTPPPPSSSDNSQ
ncbi:MAG TPA: hypothetical protein VMC43_01435 [Candidatus Paceibacterota bacterium]|nr:hypothetical protein [Candidatus Paceibacterota bacterium]